VLLESRRSHRYRGVARDFVEELSIMKSLVGTIATLHPEAELLVMAARLGSSEEADGALAQNQQEYDWGYLLQAAQEHGVIPLLYRHLHAVQPNAIPAEVSKRLREETIANTRSNLALTKELFNLLDLFEAHSISTIPYKGPVLAAFAYGDIALRQFVDLDLIVRKRDVLRVKELLVTRGWRPEFELNDAQEAAFLDHYYDYGFTNERGLLIEIHWELTEGFFSIPIDVDGLWKRLKEIEIARRRIMTLSPEDSLLIVCVHSSKHLWSRLGWISDVARLIATNEDLNWRQVSDHAAELGATRMFYLGLLLANQLLGATLPEQISRDINSDPTSSALAAEIIKRLFEKRSTSPGILETAKLHVRMRERAADRARYCSRLLLNTTVGDWTSIKIPRPLFFLYYLVRPFRLAGKYGRRFFASRRLF
jgi:hypothetical protein